ncbi:prolipoprotein diacylglyceryl transferase [uncultured Ruminobacter sp.]|uniref:prolipoprotein diacylglyceryl transferase n=1 Tax=uncultured Ruminobacter sp. TaxID=538947 RepID=UPI0025FB3508|nr:prolipoprotein diacylglyceryl transferase [uncultured Ruminobacter sp.]
MFLHWNVDPILFTIPVINLSLRWYGLFFAVGFLLGYYFANREFRNRNLNTDGLDKLLGYMIAGTLIGARLGHCLAYDPQFYLTHPVEILKIWQGGLASHGGGLGLIFTTLLYCKIYKYNFLNLADLLCIPTAFVGGMIRVGNFFNSEIYGKPTNADYGVIFDRIDSIPRHPVQMYESLSYFLISVFLYSVYKYSQKRGSGFVLGLFFITVFSVRIVLEYFKPEQASYDMNNSILTVGQYLSIPFVVAGLVLCILSSLLPSLRNKSEIILNNDVISK